MLCHVSDLILHFSIQSTVNSEIFARFIIFVNNVKRHICDIKKSRTKHDLPISVYD